MQRIELTPFIIPQVNPDEYADSSTHDGNVPCTHYFRTNLKPYAHTRILDFQEPTQLFCYDIFPSEIKTIYLRSPAPASNWDNITLS